MLFLQLFVWTERLLACVSVAHLCFLWYVSVSVVHFRLCFRGCFCVCAWFVSSGLALRVSVFQAGRVGMEGNVM